VLWVALAMNGGMFLTEWVAGLAAGSASLQADALDFLSDAANYGISLSVVGLVLAWRARAALVKGVSMGLLGLWVAGNTLWHVVMGTLPQMVVVGLVALLANGLVALMLSRYRAGDSNMRSVWICSRNDAVGNVAVVLAALGVFGTGSGGPDIIVAAAMASLSLWGACQIIRQSIRELHQAQRAAVPAEPCWYPLAGRARKKDRPAPLGLCPAPRVRGRFRALPPAARSPPPPYDPIPSAGAQPRTITVGPDGNLWFTEDYANKVGCLAPLHH
jgi:Cation efflux family